MEHCKITKLKIQLYQSLWQKNWIEVNDLSRGQYSDNMNISLKTIMLRSDLSVSSDAYIVAKETIEFLAAVANEDYKARKDAAGKINNIFIDDAESLHIFMPMYNLLEYSYNYSMTPGSLRNYHRDGINEVDHLSIKRKQ